MPKKLLLIIPALFFVLNSLFLILPALAADDNINLQIPLGTVSQLKTSTGFETYFSLWFNIIIGSVGVLAVIMIIWNSTKWLTAAGASGAISEAKTGITMAVIGLLISLFSYSMLYLLNPNLTILRLPALPNATMSSSQSSTANAQDIDCTGKTDGASCNSKKFCKDQTCISCYNAGTSCVIYDKLTTSACCNGCSYKSSGDWTCD
jgi:hypothetical protein